MSSRIRRTRWVWLYCCHHVLNVALEDAGPLPYHKGPVVDRIGILAATRRARASRVAVPGLVMDDTQPSLVR